MVSDWMPTRTAETFEQVHERAIAAVTDLLVRSRDGRYQAILKRLIDMRTPAQVARMEAERGLR